MKTFIPYMQKRVFLPALMSAMYLLFPVILQAQFAVSTTTTLPGVLAAAVAWGDYDNDGDLDILLTGQNSLSTAISHVYKNIGGGVFTTAATLIGVSNGAVAWGDYDNDGDLDILLTGMDNSSTPVSRVYRNDGDDNFISVFTLTGIYSGSVAWGDYDNDGDLDILLAGQTGIITGIAGIYKNNGNDTFTQTVTFPGVYNGAAAAWGDYDNDGRIDVVLAGQTGLLSGIARIYRNSGNDNFSTTIDLSNLSLGLSQADAVWGDYDNDGDLDLLVSGNNLLGLVNITTIYRNDGSNTFTATANLLGLLSGSAAWGDYDNDGDLDILQTGVSLGLGTSRVYRNDDNDNFEVAATLTSLLMSSVSWGDHDNDGDLDILIAGDTGLNPVTLLYNNTSTSTNTAPDAPGTLQVVLTSGTSATLSWSRATDAETPQNGLSYSVAIGTVEGNAEVKTGHADMTTGYRIVPELGNVFSTTSTFVTGLIPGHMYYWYVQSIDAGLQGSTFASASFFTPTTEAAQLIISSISPANPQSGSSLTFTIDVQNSYGQVVAVTQATTVDVSFSNPYLILGSGSTQAVVGVGESSTTLTLTINNTSSASVTTMFTVTSPNLSSTSQSVTILPSDAYIASRLVVTDITPQMPGSGEMFTVTVESQNSFGQSVTVTQATTIGVSFDNPYLTLSSGSTQAVVGVGESMTTLTLTINSTSSASVTTVLTIASPDLLSTSQSVTILPSDAYIASRLVVTDITPSMPGSGEAFVVTVESQNSLGQAVAVTQATMIGASFDNPYLTLSSGSTQAVVGVGESMTTLTLTINSTSSASVTTMFTVTSPNLSSTSQSVTILPSNANVASRLVVTDITPSAPGSGEAFVVTVESQNSLGQAVAVTQATMIGVSFDNPYLTLGSGSTQAVVGVGESSTTLTLTINSTSSASVTTVLTIASPDLLSTSQSITIAPLYTSGRDMNISVLLEGPYDASTDKMTTLLVAQDLIPYTQPYNMGYFSYAGNETVQTFPADVVDWVMVELRTSLDSTSMVFQRAVLLREDGTLSDENGYTPTIPDTVPAGYYYVVVDHRNHLPVISTNAVLLNQSGIIYDFTDNREQAFMDFYDPMVRVDDGAYAMIGGDVNMDTIINAIDRATVRNATGDTGYLLTDLNLDGIINAIDRLLVRNNTFAVSQVP